MESSASAPALATGGIAKSSLATPGKGWAKLKTNLRTQRVVKQCCGVDMWEIYDHFDEERGNINDTSKLDSASSASLSFAQQPLG